jgi:hypothetical protein
MTDNGAMNSTRAELRAQSPTEELIPEIALCDIMITQGVSI